MASQISRIYSAISNFKRPVSVGEIARITEINAKIVSARCHDLVLQGKLYKEFHGHFISKDIYGMLGEETLPRLQNLCFTSEDCSIPPGIPEMIIEFEEDARIRIQFGSTRDKITWKVKAPRGLDLYGFRLARKIVDRECEIKGFNNLSWESKNVELFQDNTKRRLEGVKCVTFEDLEGFLEKYYNKGEGMRKEIRVSVPTPIDHLIALMRGGQPAYELSQMVGLLTKKLDENLDVQKHRNADDYEFRRIMKGIFEGITRQNLLFEKVLEKLGGM